jgi:hypothetical protein
LVSIVEEVMEEARLVLVVEVVSNRSSSKVMDCFGY